jgi:hypothetical protein
MMNGARMDYPEHGGSDKGAPGSLSRLKVRMTLILSGWYAHQVKKMLSHCRLASSEDVKVQEVQALMDSALQSLSGRRVWC